jgi:cytochrome d ubiquinol oxidase subunit I
VEITHAAFQIMVGAGSVLIGLSVWFWIAWFRLREKVLQSRLLLYALVVCGPLGFFALEAGWFVTEVGRQPWIIQGLMRTREAVTPAQGVAVTFYSFTALYVVLTITVIILLRKLANTPAAEHVDEGPQRTSVGGTA